MSIGGRMRSEAICQWSTTKLKYDSSDIAIMWHNSRNSTSHVGWPTYCDSDRVGRLCVITKIVVRRTHSLFYNNKSVPKFPKTKRGNARAADSVCRIIRFMIHHAKQLPSSWCGGMNAQMSMEARCAVGCNGMNIFISLVTKNIKPIILQDIWAGHWRRN